MSNNIDFQISSALSMPEFVGTAYLDTIGLVIPSPDEALMSKMGIGEEYSCVGLISSRTGASGQIVACDDACKATGMVPVSIDLPRDTKGWGGHGCYIVLAGTTPENAREAVKIALDHINKYAGEVYISDAGHLEFAYTAKAGPVVAKAFGAKEGPAFGFMAGSPAAIGLVMADKTVKSSPLDIVSYMTPSIGTSHTNEVILSFSGESSAVKNGVLTARDTGMSLLSAMGSKIVTLGYEPFIF